MTSTTTSTARGSRRRARPWRRPARRRARRPAPVRPGSRARTAHECCARAVRALRRARPSRCDPSGSGSNRITSATPSRRPCPPAASPSPGAAGSASASTGERVARWSGGRARATSCASRASLSRGSERASELPTSRPSSGAASSEQRGPPESTDPRAALRDRPAGQQRRGPGVPPRRPAAGAGMRGCRPRSAAGRASTRPRRAGDRDQAADRHRGQHRVTEHEQAGEARCPTVRPETSTVRPAVPRVAARASPRPRQGLWPPRPRRAPPGSAPAPAGVVHRQPSPSSVTTLTAYSLTGVSRASRPGQQGPATAPSAVARAATRPRAAEHDARGPRPGPRARRPRRARRPDRLVSEGLLGQQRAAHQEPACRSCGACRPPPRRPPATRRGGARGRAPR